MQTAHRSLFSGENITEDTNSIPSGCNTITFDNYGSSNCKIFINDHESLHTGDYIVLQAGKMLILGNRYDIIVQDKFDIVFLPLEGSVNGINILRETIMLLT